MRQIRPDSGGMGGIPGKGSNMATFSIPLHLLMDRITLLIQVLNIVRDI